MSTEKQQPLKAHVQIFAAKLAREANAPVSPAFEILAIKELTEALAVRAEKESQ